MHNAIAYLSAVLFSIAMPFMAGCSFFGLPVGKERARANVLEQEIAHYKTWKQPVGYEDFEPSVHPLPAFVKYYVNDAGMNSFDKPVDGSVFVKEQFDKDKQLIGLTVMKKIEGYDPDNNDWFWAIANTDSHITNAGRLNSAWTSNCIDCHRKGDGGGDLLFVND